MYLSETPNVKEWISQFLSEDRPFVEILLNSLELVSQETLLRELSQLIIDKAKEVEKPIALVPLREMANNQSYYKPVNNRNAKPALLLPQSLPGSEAIIANLATNLKRQSGKYGDFVGSPSLKNMRDSRCRSVFFLDDFLGSGKRVCDFVPSFCMNKTIKSWSSYNFLKFYLLTYSSTKYGNKNIHQTNFFADIQYVMKCPTFYDVDWTAYQLENIKKTCFRYAPSKHSQNTNEQQSSGFFQENDERKMALGFRGTMGLLVFEHSAPNNLPAIFWDKSKKWHPLFPGRAIPNEIKECFSQKSSEHRFLEILKSIGQKRLSEGKWFLEATPTIRKIILVLGVMAKKNRELEKISDYTKLSTLEVKKIIIYCRKWGFVDEYNSLTAKGLNELSYARKMKFDCDKVLDGDMDFYYPTRLRGVNRH